MILANSNSTHGPTYVFRVDDVLEVLQSDLSVVADGAAEDVLQPFQVLRRELTPGTAIVRRACRIAAPNLFPKS